MKSIEQLLKTYQPNLYKLSKKPLVNEKAEEYKGMGCTGLYSNVKFGIDEDYWYNVIKADDLDDD
jgi:hypothetical protein